MGKKDKSNKRKHGDHAPSDAPHGAGRSWTVSLAVPARMVDMTSPLSTRSALAQSLCHTLSQYSIDELVILSSTKPPRKASETSNTNPADFLELSARYLETPPYMRERLFQPACKELHPDLQPIYETGNASILPHHQALDASLPTPSPNGLIYRSGVTLKAQEPAPSYRRYVNAGLEQLCTIAEPYPKSTRVTLAIEPEEYENAIEKGRRIQASVVEPESAPREEAGVYTGFTIRRALGYSGMFEECPYAGGYDLNLAFSNFKEGGQDASALDARENEGFKHLLIVVGEEEKLDGVLARDGKLKDMGIKVTELFDLPLNTPKEASVEDMLKEGLEHVQKLIKAMK